MDNRSRFRAVLGWRSAFILVPVLFLTIGEPVFTQKNRPPNAGPPQPPPAGPISSGVMPGSPELVPLLTDGTQLALPSRFGPASGYRVNDAGDFVFITGDSSAAFLRRAGGATIRLVQRNDPVPGFPESLCDTVSGVSINNAGLVVFDVEFMLAAGATAQHAILTYGPTGYHVVAHTRATAPGTGGALYGRTMGLGGLNDYGDVAFTASLSAFAGAVDPQRTTLFVAPAGGAPIRIAGPGDTAPGTGGGKFDQIGQRGLNDAGEVLFQAPIAGGSGGYGLFAGSADGRVRKIVAHGDPRPGGGTFDLGSGLGTSILNGSGDVAFTTVGAAGSVWTHNTTDGVVPVAIAYQTDAPPPLSGPVGPAMLQAFNDAGETAFTTTVPVPSPGAGMRNILVRSEHFNGEHALTLIAAQNERLPGPTTIHFGPALRAFSLNNEGVMTFFNGSTATGTAWRALLQHDRGAAPLGVRIRVQEGDPVPLEGSPIYGLLNTTSTSTLPDGTVMFLADVLGGEAFSGVFLEGPEVSQALVSTDQPLPAGARQSWRPFRLGAAASYVSFSAELAGGQTSLWLHNLATGTTARVGGEGDQSPDVGGFISVSSASPAVNRRGEVAFTMRHIVSGSRYGATSLCLRDVSGTLRKIATVGDLYEDDHSIVRSIGFGTSPPRRLNDLGQVVFTASLSVPGRSQWVPALFVGSPGSPLQRLAMAGEEADESHWFVDFGVQSINASGAVAFGATVQDATGNRVSGLFIRTQAGNLVKIALGGEPWSSGCAFPQTLPGSFAFNDRGEMAFMTPLVDGCGGGVFIGSASGLTAVALNGDLAPPGGRIMIDAQAPSLDLNDAGDIVFRTALAGGSANSGAFLLRRSEGTMRTVVLQGQPAPGTLGKFFTVSPFINGWPSENLGLGPSGELLVTAIFEVDGVPNLGFWRFGTDNKLEMLFARGSLARQSGGGTFTSAPQGGAVNDAGHFLFSVGVFGGRFTEAIYITK